MHLLIVKKENRRYGKNTIKLFTKIKIYAILHIKIDNY